MDEKTQDSKTPGAADDAAKGSGVNQAQKTGAELKAEAEAKKTADAEAKKAARKAEAEARIAENERLARIAPPVPSASTVTMDVVSLSQLIAESVAKGIAAGMEAARIAAKEAGEEELPPVDPKEIQSELEAQLSEARYLIEISKGPKYCVDPVPLGVNGILRTVKRGEPAVITSSMLEVLENSLEQHIDPDTFEPYEVTSYPYVVHAEIPQADWQSTLSEVLEKYAPRQRNKMRGAPREQQVA